MVDLRYLRILRLLRILKLARYFHSLQLLFKVMRTEAASFGSALFILALVLVLCPRTGNFL